MPVEIRTPRLRLAPVAPADLDAMCALLWQADVRRFLCDDALLPREEIDAAIAESCAPSSSAERWRIDLAAGEGGGALAGFAALQAPTAATLRLRAIGWRSREVLIALDPAYWGRGLAREAIEALLEHARADPVTFALLAVVDEPNARSHRLFAACGFTEIGRVAGPRHRLVVHERAL